MHNFDCFVFLYSSFFQSAFMLHDSSIRIHLLHNIVYIMKNVWMLLRCIQNHLNMRGAVYKLHEKLIKIVYAKLFKIQLIKSLSGLSVFPELFRFDAIISYGVVYTYSFANHHYSVAFLRT